MNQYELLKTKTDAQTQAATLRQQRAELAAELAKAQAAIAGERRTLAQKFLGRGKVDATALTAATARAQVLPDAIAELDRQIAAAESGLPLIEVELRKAHFADGYAEARVRVDKLRRVILDAQPDIAWLRDFLGEIEAEKEYCPPALQQPAAWDVADTLFVLRGIVEAKELAEAWRYGHTISDLAKWDPANY